jgi:hypothetical protein
MLRRGSLRRLALTMVLAMFTALLFALVLRDATPPRPVPDAAMATLTPVGHRTYTFTLSIIPFSDAPWHPGQQLVFYWMPQFTSFSMSKHASAVHCTVAFYGPFPTYAVAQAQWEGPLSLDAPPSTPPVVPAFVPLPLLVDDWTSQLQRTVVTLPATLAPGYSVVQERERYADGEGGSGFIVSIAAA